MIIVEYQVLIISKYLLRTKQDVGMWYFGVLVQQEHCCFSTPQSSVQSWPFYVSIGFKLLCGISSSPCVLPLSENMPVGVLAFQLIIKDFKILCFESDLILLFKHGRFILYKVGNCCKNSFLWHCHSTLPFHPYLLRCNMHLIWQNLALPKTFLINYTM